MVPNCYKQDHSLATAQESVRWYHSLSCMQGGDSGFPEPQIQWFSELVRNPSRYSLPLVTRRYSFRFVPSDLDP